MCADAPRPVSEIRVPPSLYPRARARVRPFRGSLPIPPSGAQQSEMEEQLRRLHEDKLAAETSVATLQNLYLAQVC